MTDERVKEALRPCPFCGSPATEPEKISQYGRPLWRTGCVLFCVSMTRGSKSLLKHDWNTRAAERLAKIEALEEVKQIVALMDDYVSDDFTAGKNTAYNYVTEMLDSMIAELKEEGE